MICNLKDRRQVLSKGQLTASDLGRKARRLLIKLSEASEIIPASVLIRGLSLIESQPVSGGGFADIYRAMYRGQEVALKHLRVRQDQDSQNIRRVNLGSLIVPGSELNLVIGIWEGGAGLATADAPECAHLFGH